MISPNPNQLSSPEVKIAQIDYNNKQSIPFPISLNDQTAISGSSNMTSPAQNAQNSYLQVVANEVFLPEIQGSDDNMYKTMTLLYPNKPYENLNGVQIILDSKQIASECTQKVLNANNLLQPKKELEQQQQLQNIKNQQVGDSQEATQFSKKAMKQNKKDTKKLKKQQSSQSLFSIKEEEGGDSTHILGFQSAQKKQFNSKQKQSKDQTSSENSCQQQQKQKALYNQQQQLNLNQNVNYFDQFLYQNNFNNNNNNFMPCQMPMQAQQQQQQQNPQQFLQQQNKGQFEQLFKQFQMLEGSNLNEQQQQQMFLQNMQNQFILFQQQLQQQQTQQQSQQFQQQQVQFPYQQLPFLPQQQQFQTSQMINTTLQPLVNPNMPMNYFNLQQQQMQQQQMQFLDGNNKIYKQPDLNINNMQQPQQFPYVNQQQQQFLQSEQKLEFQNLSENPEDLESHQASECSGLNQSGCKKRSKFDTKNLVKNFLNSFLSFVISPEEEPVILKILGFPPEKTLQEKEQQQQNSIINNNQTNNDLMEVSEASTAAEKINNNDDNMSEGMQKLTEIRNKLKNFFKGKKFNRVLLKEFMFESIFRPLFQFYLENRAPQWIETGRMKDKDSHIRALKNFTFVCQNYENIKSWRFRYNFV